MKEHERKEGIDTQQLLIHIYKKIIKFFLCGSCNPKIGLHYVYWIFYQADPP